jgi:TRAP-type C4-dicarboxylate transport system permease small subunit
MASPGVAPTKADSADRTRPDRADPLHWLRVVVRAAGAIFLIAIVVDVLVGVVARYALHISLPWNEELARFLLVWLSFIGAAAAAASRATIRVDSLIGHFKPGRTRLILEGVVAALSILALIVFIWASRGLFGTSASSTSPGSGISAFWVNLALPVSAVLVIVFIAFDLIRIVTRHEIPRASESAPDEPPTEL